MRQLCLLLFIILCISCTEQEKVNVLQVPGYDRYCRVDPEGESVIPNGRIVKPAGTFIRIAPDPFGLTLSPDGSIALAVHNNALTLIGTGALEARRENSPFQGKGSYMGAAITNDNSIAYLSGGDNGDVIVLDLSSMKIIRRISLNGNYGGQSYEGSFTGDIKLSDDGTKLYALDQFNFRLATIDAKSSKVTSVARSDDFPWAWKFHMTAAMPMLQIQVFLIILLPPDSPQTTSKKRVLIFLLTVFHQKKQSMELRSKEDIFPVLVLLVSLKQYLCGP